jgi:hypothetical protein
MPVTADQPGPYGPASGVIGLIERHRNKGLPSPVDADVLGRAGITPSLIPRTLQTLTALDLLTDDGRPSEVLEGLRLAPESEYKQRVAEWLTGTYADALQFVDPAIDDETKIRDAFRNYKPIGQQGRMVSLFIALFAYAGVAPERVRQPAKRSPGNSAPKPRAPAKPPGEAAKPPEHVVGGVPPALTGLLASLPTLGKDWTKDGRQKFMDTFGSLVDLFYPHSVGPKTTTAAPDKDAAGA